MNGERIKKSVVAAIVVAYNEEPTISAIVKALVDSTLFRDVIVISDGSTDGTADEARAAGATLVHQLPWKHGKGAAMMHGVSHTDTPILFFADADLLGLTPDHLKRILRPVLAGTLAMCVGLRDRGPILMKISAHLPLIGGERAMRRNVFEDIPDNFMQGFMVESALNYYCRSHHLPYGTVELPGLHIRRKMQKVGFWKGLKEYLHMWREVIGAMLVVRIAYLKGEFL